MDFHEGLGSPAAAHALARSGVNPQRRAVVHQHVIQVLVVGLGKGVLHGRHAAEAVGGDVAGFAPVQEDGHGHLGLPATKDGILLVCVGYLIAEPGQQVTTALVEQGRWPSAGPAASRNSAARPSPVRAWRRVPGCAGRGFAIP